MVGTPLTTRDFYGEKTPKGIRRYRVDKETRIWPRRRGCGSVTSAKSNLKNLLLVGDSRFPGPGLPAVAAGGWAAAHELVDFRQQCEILGQKGSSTLIVKKINNESISLNDEFPRVNSRRLSILFFLVVSFSSNFHIPQAESYTLHCRFYSRTLATTLAGIPPAATTVIRLNY